MRTSTTLPLLPYHLLSILLSYINVGNLLVAAHDDVARCGGVYSNTRLVLKDHLMCDCTQLVVGAMIIQLQHHSTLDLNGYRIECRHGRRTNIGVTGSFNIVRNGVIPTVPAGQSSFVELRDDDFAVQVSGSHNILEYLQVEPSRRCSKCRIPPSLLVDGSNNTIANVVIHEPWVGVVVRGSNHRFNDVTIEESQHQGILVDGGGNHSILDSKLRLSLGEGIALVRTEGTLVKRISVSLSSGGIRIIDGARNEVRDCFVDSRGVTPIALEGNGSLHSVVDNTIAGKSRYAIYIDSEVFSSVATGNVVGRDFYPLHSDPIFHENKDDCTALWLNNKGGRVGCEYLPDPLVVTDRYASIIFDYWSMPKYTILACILLTSSLLSAFGSASMIFLIFCKKRADVTIFHRILLGICAADFISSLSACLQPILLPKETMTPFALGNMASCRFVGFGVYFFLASTIYCCELALYFSLTIRHGWSERKVTQCMEPWVHILPFAIILAHNIVALTSDVFHPSSSIGLCLVGCRYKFGTDQCVDGSNPLVARFMQIPAAFIPPVCAMLGTMWTVGVYKAVREQEIKNLRYSFERSTRVPDPTLTQGETTLQGFNLWKGNRNDSESMSESAPDAGRRMSLQGRSPSTGVARTQHGRTKAVALQAILYCCAYLNSFLGILVWTILRLLYELNREMRLSVSNGSTGLYIALVIVFSLHPLLGFLNWLTYVRPILEKFRRQYPQRSAIWALGKILTGHLPPNRRASPIFTSRPANRIAEENSGNSLQDDID